MRDRLLAFYRTLPSWAVPLFFIVLAVFLGNFMYLSGLATNDTIAWTANISHSLCRVTCGRPAIDPNVGYITQTLGHLSAMDLLHGHLPWWNYFEGLGQPLAGEMQAASLFPLTLLFAFSSGLLWFHVCLQVIAGFSTYLLAKRLSIPALVATGLGAVFALNGTYAWLGNAVLNPVAFLPMLLLGIELIFDNAPSTSRRGWYLAPIALALSLYAGFPEVAFLDGLFAAGWAAVRLASLPKELRLVAGRRVGVAGISGLALSLPIMVPFFDFYKVAFVGNHVASVDGVQATPFHTASMFLDPYVFGTIFSNKQAAVYWSGVGGYFTASVTALALLGLVGARHRPLRLYLGLWIALGLLGTFNIAHARSLWNLIPLVKTVAFARYVMPSFEMGMVVLAALGFADLVSSARAKRHFIVTSSFTLLLVLWSALEARSINHGVVLLTKTRVIFVGLDAIPFLAVGALLVLGRFTNVKVGPLLIALVLVGESVLLFMVPTAEAAKQVTVDEGPMTYLQTHQGQERFLDFSILNANWGSQYGLNSLSAIDLPFPKVFSQLIATKLFPGLTPMNQFVIQSGLIGIIKQEHEVVDHYAAYQAASVKYLLLPVHVVPLASLVRLGAKEVFADSFAAIYELPSPRLFFSTSTSACTVTSTSYDRATVTCPPGGATLIRSELPMAGWHAMVNGQSVTITPSDQAYQSVLIPGGTSTVTFRFLPPHEELAIIGALLAVLFLLGSLVTERSTRPRHRRRREKSGTLQP